MLVYEYMKANPAQRAGLVNGNWHDLFASDETPYSVKCQLIEIQKLNNVFDDYMLYWHSLLTTKSFILDKFVWPCRAFWANPFLKLAYEHGVCQGMEDGALAIIMLIYDTGREMPVLSKLQFKKLVHYLEGTGQGYYRNRADTLSIEWFVVHALKALDNKFQILDIPRQHLYNDDLCKHLLEVMEPDWIEDATYEQCQQVEGIYRDLPASLVRYKSLSEVKAVHDAQTEEAEKKLMAQYAGTNIKYTPEFIKVAEENGFTVPKNQAAFMARGKRHKNCVGSYYDRQVANYRDDFLTRLLFWPDATLELKCYCRHGRIVSTVVIQFRGMQNKEIEPPQELSRLQIALTGMHSSILGTEVQHDTERT